MMININGLNNDVQTLLQFDDPPGMTDSSRYPLDEKSMQIKEPGWDCQYEEGIVLDGHQTLAIRM